MPRVHAIVLETPRLLVRLATEEDADHFVRLWTHPRIMANVGFPEGIPVSREEMTRTIARRGFDEFAQLLVVVRTLDGQALGECKMHPPDAEGIARTDVKLFPEHWGKGYGQEVKRGLLDYLFAHTDCRAVEASPNVANKASIRMQEAVGGVRVGQGVHEFPEEMRARTVPVHYYLYRVFRADWERRARA
jgi:[ribosomal protein S5]-alanine N-acetyltransferase